MTENIISVSQQPVSVTLTRSEWALVEIALYAEEKKSRGYGKRAKFQIDAERWVRKADRSRRFAETIRRARLAS